MRQQGDVGGPALTGGKCLGRQWPKAGERRQAARLGANRGGGGTSTGGASATVTSGDVEILIRIRIKMDLNSFKL
jgi:hypothetical protein